MCGTQALGVWPSHACLRHGARCASWGSSVAQEGASICELDPGSLVTSAHGPRCGALLPLGGCPGASGASTWAEYLQNLTFSFDALCLFAATWEILRHTICAHADPGVLLGRRGPRAPWPLALCRALTLVHTSDGDRKSQPGALARGSGSRRLNPRFPWTAGRAVPPAAMPLVGA